MVTTINGMIKVKATYLFNLASATLKGVLKVEIRSWHKHRFEMSEASWKYIVCISLDQIRASMSVSSMFLSPASGSHFSVGLWKLKMDI